MSNVEYIKKNKNSSMDWTVVETLRCLADEIERGEVDYNKCFVCLLEEKGNSQFSTGFRMAQMTGREAVSLLEQLKTDLLMDMR